MCIRDSFEVVDETNNVDIFGVTKGDVYQVGSIHHNFVKFTTSDNNFLAINISSIKKVPEPEGITEDNKLCEVYHNLRAENKKQAEMLNLAWSDLEEYGNAFCYLDSKQRQSESKREHWFTKYVQVDAELDYFKVENSDLFIKNNNLLGEMSKFLLENFANKEGIVKIGQNTFKCKKKMRLF